MAEDMSRHPDTWAGVLIVSAFLACVVVVWALYGLSVRKQRRRSRDKRHDDG
jgi:hypothetical protein